MCSSGVVLKLLTLAMVLLNFRLYSFQRKFLATRRRVQFFATIPIPHSADIKFQSSLKHLLTDKQDLLSTAIQRDSKFDLSYVHYLIEMGAVYIRSPSDAKFVRSLTDQQIQPGDNVRYHPSPKRYDMSNIDWGSRIIVSDPNFIVLDKPFGLPVGPTADNLHENVCRGLGDYLNRDNVWNVHRLDVDTSGLLVMGLNSDALGMLSKLFRHRKIAKTYRMIVMSTRTAAVTETETNHPMSLLETNKTLVHIMKPSTFSPRVFVDPARAVEGDFECRSRIIARSPVASKSKRAWRQWLISQRVNGLEDASLRWFEAGFTEWLDSAPGDEDAEVSFCEVDLDLHTGRTHQCRAQMNALGRGLHIAGDGLYRGGPVPVPSPGQKKAKIDTWVDDASADVDDVVLDDEGGDDVSTSRYLALQASKIEFLNYFSDNDSRALMAKLEKQIMPYMPVGHVFQPSKSLIRKTRAGIMAKISTKWEQYLVHKRSVEERRLVLSSDSEVKELQEDVLRFVVSAEIPKTWWQPLSSYLNRQK